MLLAVTAEESEVFTPTTLFKEHMIFWEGYELFQKGEKKNRTKKEMKKKIRENERGREIICLLGG